jgi:hypothetical protein
MEMLEPGSRLVTLYVKKVTWPSTKRKLAPPECMLQTELNEQKFFGSPGPNTAGEGQGLPVE